MRMKKQLAVALSTVVIGIGLGMTANQAFAMRENDGNSAGGSISITNQPQNMAFKYRLYATCSTTSAQRARGLEAATLGHAIWVTNGSGSSVEGYLVKPSGAQRFNNPPQKYLDYTTSPTGIIGDSTYFSRRGTASSVSVKASIVCGTYMKGNPGAIVSQATFTSSRTVLTRK